MSLMVQKTDAPAGKLLSSLTVMKTAHEICMVRVADFDVTEPSASFPDQSIAANIGARANFALSDGYLRCRKGPRWITASKVSFATARRILQILHGAFYKYYVMISSSVLWRRGGDVEPNGVRLSCFAAADFRGERDAGARVRRGGLRRCEAACDASLLAGGQPAPLRRRKGQIEMPSLVNENVITLAAWIALWSYKSKEGGETPQADAVSRCYVQLSLSAMVG